MPATIDTVQALYAAYNNQDLDALSAGLAEDVDWPDGAARLHGRAVVRQYWIDQWSATRTHDEPHPIVEIHPGVVVVGRDQVVRDIRGEERSRGRFLHVLHLREGLATRLDILPV